MRNRADSCRNRSNIDELALDHAQSVAISALAFIAKDLTRFGRFIALTGLSRDDFAGLVHNPNFQVAVLDHMLGDESLLLVFASENGVAPSDVAPARDFLIADCAPKGR